MINDGNELFINKKNILNKYHLNTSMTIDDKI
jgi:hypothetical protein